MIYLLTGLHNKRFIENLNSNLDRIGKGTTPVIVCQNGIEYNRKGCVVLRSEPGIMNFLNTAFDYVKSVAGDDDWFARVDVDDYYTSEYISNIKSVMSECDWSFISCNYIADYDDLIYCKTLDDNVSFGLGGTLAGNIKKSLYFNLPECNTIGEDFDWCQRMKETGLKGKDRSPEGFALSRNIPNHNHTFYFSADELVRIWPIKAYSQGEVSLKKIASMPTLDNPIESKIDFATIFKKLSNFRFVL